MEKQIVVGRVLRAGSRTFAVGCRVLQEDIPAFGALVRAPALPGDVYGLIYDVTVQDDLLTRRLVLADPPQEVIRDLRENRLIPIEVSVLAVGCRSGDAIRHGIPPQPPVALDALYQCPPEEVAAFTRQFGYFRLILDTPGIPADALLVASLRLAAQARPPEDRAAFLVEAGREVARLLARDLVRVEGILRQLSEAAR